MRLWKLQPKQNQPPGPTVRAEAPMAPPPAPAAPDPARPSVQVTPSVERLDPNIEAAYAAFNSGRTDAARQAYDRALAVDGMNRDALLGLAALDVRAHDFLSAEAHYRRVLEIDPRDATAQAGLLGLRSNVDPVEAESRIKNLINQGPDAAVLQFALGNQYAMQARWAEAQDAYFRAWAADPENPDFAFNLAVSLDQLRQPRQALEYYRKAIALADKRQPGFDRDQAATRARELSQ